MSILSSCLIYFIFKLISQSKANLFYAIILNYIIATSTGLLISGIPENLEEIVTANWFYISVVIGILFIVLFFIVGLSTKHAGLTITSIGTKMSVVFPMLFSILYYNEKIHSLKIVGIFLALLSIVLASIKKKQGKSDMKEFIYPFCLFVGMGLIDSLVKFNQEEYLKNTGAIDSSTLIFAVSALVGMLVLLIRIGKSKEKLRIITLIYGFALGLANFGSLYFMILALNAKFIDSSIVFALNNLFIIVISALTGNLIFKERLSKLNWAGVIISLLAITSLTITL